MEDKTMYLFIDAETDGLYGEFISIAMVATDSIGNELAYSYMGVSNPEKHIKDQWVRENVLPILGEYEEYEDEHSLLEAFWSFWRAHASDAYVITDVMHPVESRLFTSCVMHDVKERSFQGPFPILDLSSMLYAIGLDPLMPRKSLYPNSDVEGELHNALYDARLMAAIWKKIVLPHRNKL